MSVVSTPGLTCMHDTNSSVTKLNKSMYSILIVGLLNNRPKKKRNVSTKNNEVQLKFPFLFLHPCTRSLLLHKIVMAQILNGNIESANPCRLKQVH